MFKKIALILVIAQTMPLCAGNIFGRNRNAPINPANHAGGVFSDNIKKSTDNAVTVMEAVKELAAKPEVAEQVSYHTTKGTIEGAGAAIGTGVGIVVAKTGTTVATTKAAIAAALASPVAPFVAAGGVMFGSGMYWVHQDAQERQKQKIGAYKRCLNMRLMDKSSSSEEINHDDTPHSCKPNERSVNAWFGNKEKTTAIKAKYHKHKQNGGHFRQDYK